MIDRVDTHTETYVKQKQAKGQENNTAKEVDKAAMRARLKSGIPSKYSGSDAHG